MLHKGSLGEVAHWKERKLQDGQWFRNRDGPSRAGSTSVWFLAPTSRHKKLHVGNFQCRDHLPWEILGSHVKGWLPTLCNHHMKCYDILLSFKSRI